MEYDRVKRIVQKTMADYNLSDQIDLDDVVQGVMEKYLLNPKRKYIKHLVIDYLRQNEGDARYEEKFTHIMAERHRSSRDLSMVGKITHPDELIQIRQIITQIKPKWRAPFVLYFVWGMTQDEIGFVLGVSEATICVLMKELVSFIERKKLIEP